jgi:hypothetical protein
MTLDLDDEQARALLNVLVEVIEADHYPLSPRVQTLRAILAKFGEVGGLSTGTRAEARPSRAANLPGCRRPRTVIRGAARDRAAASGNGGGLFLCQAASRASVIITGAKLRRRGHPDRARTLSSFWPELSSSWLGPRPTSKHRTR